jgi:hypothetical protein
MKRALSLSAATRASMLASLVSLASLAVVLAACDKPKPPVADADAGASGATAGASASAGVHTKPAPTPAAAPAAPSPDIEGLGAVPAWAPDRTTKQCTADPAIKPRLEALKKGDAGVGAGTTDVAALATELAVETCFLHRRALAQALNDGGFALYNAKKIDAANRHWRAALVVRPSLIVARYNLACGLALAGKGDAAVGQMTELARAATDGDAAAASSLEKAKSDKDLESIRSQPAFEAAVKTSNAGLVGPRRDPDTAAQAIALLPEELRKVRDELGVTKTGSVVYKPAVTGFWTWRPVPSTELLVATIIDDPAKAGKPKADLNQDYGAIAVFRRDAFGKLTLLTVRRTGESPPSVAAGKNGSVAYSFEQPCGALSGTLTWNGSAIDIKEKNCRDL